MTRLTKTMRDDIVAKILAATDFPAIKEKIEKDFFDASTIWAKSFLPPHFNDSIKHLPREWFATCASYELRGEFHPVNLMKPEDDRRFYHLTAHAEAFACPFGMIVKPPGRRDHQVKAPDVIVVQSWLQELIDRANKWFEDYSTVETELHNTLRAYGSVEKLLKDFPQFAKHITIPQKTYAVAVVPSKLSALLTATGFDNTEK